MDTPSELSAFEISRFIAGYSRSPLARWSKLKPWELCARSVSVVRDLLGTILDSDYLVSDDVAIHRTATVENGAVLKGPLILGRGCFVATGAYLRGGNWIAENCTFGPGVELKSSFVFPGTKLAHFNFVGDSLLGANVNLEVGSIICNYRNERTAKEILVRVESTLHRTGSDKFGALLGDGCRIGANAVLAPGALLGPGAVIRRAELCDQELHLGKGQSNAV